MAKKKSDGNNIVYMAYVNISGEIYSYYGVSDDLRKAQLRHLRNTYRGYTNDAIAIYSQLYDVPFSAWTFKILYTGLDRDGAFDIKAFLVRHDSASINQVYKHTIPTKWRR